MVLQQNTSPANWTVILATAVVTATATYLLPRAYSFAAGLVAPLVERLKELTHGLLARRIPRFGLSSYKRHLRNSILAYIDNPVGPSIRVRLEAAFAPVKLISSPTNIAYEVLSFLTDTPRFMLLGGAGSGKTTLTQALIMDVIAGRAPALFRQSVPVFVSLRKMSALEQTIEQAIDEAFANMRFPHASPYIRAARRDSQLIVVLDGLDEVGQQRPQVVQRIRDFCQADDRDLRNNYLVVTCRESSYLSEDLRDVVPAVARIEPFSNRHIRLFLDGWPPHVIRFPDGHSETRMAIQLYPEIQRDSQVRDACRNPLMVTLLTGIYLETIDFRCRPLVTGSIEQQSMSCSCIGQHAGRSR